MRRRVRWCHFVVYIERYASFAALMITCFDKRISPCAQRERVEICVYNIVLCTDNFLNLETAVYCLVHVFPCGNAITRPLTGLGNGRNLQYLPVLMPSEDFF